MLSLLNSNKIRRFAASVWAVILLFGILSFGLMSNVRVDTDLLAILPKSEDKVLTPIIDKLSEQFNRKLVVLVRFAQPNDNQTTLSKAYDNLVASALFEANELADKERQISELYQFLLPYRQQLLTAEDRQKLQANDYSAVLEQALSELYGFGKVDEDSFYQDPLRLYQHFFTSLWQFNQTADIELAGNWLKSMADSDSYFLFLELNTSPYDVNYQAQVKAALTNAQTIVKKGGGELTASGAVLFAEHGYAQSKRELGTVGLGGLIGILLLFIYSFRSLKPLLWMLLLLGASLAFALTLTLWVFGSVHIFALLMAAPLIGISIDYGFHFFTDFYFKLADSEQTLKHIGKGLTLGLISSVLAYMTFFLGQVEVLQQVALITMLGLLSMYLSIMTLLPYLIKPNKQRPMPRFLQFFGQCLLVNPLAKLFSRPLLTLAASLVVLVLLFFVVTANDDVRSYQSPPDNLVQIENKIKQLTQTGKGANTVVIVGKNLDSLVVSEQQIYQQFADEITLPSLAELLPNNTQQQQNHQLYQQFYQSALAKDFSNEMLGNTDSLQLKAFSLLRLETLLKQPALQTLLANRVVAIDSQFALLIPTAQALALPSEIAGNKVYNYNQAAEISARFSDLRKKIMLLVVVVVVLLLLVCGCRYRQLVALNIALIPVFAGLLALLLTYLLIDNVNIFNILALLLLIGMGLDYVIFLRESPAAETVIVSLMLSCVTTLLSFGLLALSQTAAVASFGLMVTIGIVLVLLLSPAVVRKDSNG